MLQSQITVGSGGLLGTGLTNGTQSRGEFLPVQESDFVFAVLAQELGFIGALVVFLLFAALIWRILSCAWRSKDPFGTLFGAGLATMLLFQVFVNVGMVIGLLPVTGIPLPFISHGGASLVSIAIGLGVMQSVNIRQTEGGVVAAGHLFGAPVSSGPSISGGGTAPGTCRLPGVR